MTRAHLQRLTRIADTKVNDRSLSLTHFCNKALRVHRLTTRQGHKTIAEHRRGYNV